MRLCVGWANQQIQWERTLEGRIATQYNKLAQNWLLEVRYYPVSLSG